MKLVNENNRSLGTSANYVDPRSCYCSVEPSDALTIARFKPYVCSCECSYGEENKQANFAAGKAKG